jgi:hypothetical protein
MRANDMHVKVLFDFSDLLSQALRLETGQGKPLEMTQKPMPRAEVSPIRWLSSLPITTLASWMDTKSSTPRILVREGLRTVDGYLQWCTTFVRTAQGTYGALAQSLIRSRSNKQPDSSLIQLTQNYYRAHGDSVPLTWLVCLLVV